MTTLEKTIATSIGSAGAPTSQPPFLAIETVEIDAHCIGSRWTAGDTNRLARIVAIIGMGQATHAARIIAELLPAQPALDHEALRTNAKRRLLVTGSTEQQRDVSRYHRDGLIFEAISWAAAQQLTGGKALLRDPHLSSTTQGLDGLMIQLDQSGSAIIRATIFEDKCSEDPRAMFRDNIMPAFKAHHGNERASDLVAAAATLIGKIGLDGTASTKAAARVLDKKYRAYRGSLAVTKSEDTLARRQRLFKGYEKLSNINPDQRIGAVLITSDDLRAWFDKLADKAVAYIDRLGVKGG